MDKENNKFVYSDIMNNLVSYKMTAKTNIGDEIKFTISDGSFTTSQKFYVLKSLTDTLIDMQSATIKLERNQGLQAIAGNYSINIFALLIRFLLHEISFLKIINLIEYVHLIFIELKSLKTFSCKKIKNNSLS
jgi:hypothetical protein